MRNQRRPARLGGIGAGNWTLSTVTGDTFRHELPITGYDPADAMLRPPSFIETLELPADAVVTLGLEIAGVDWAENTAQPLLGIAEPPAGHRFFRLGLSGGRAAHQHR